MMKLFITKTMKKQIFIDSSGFKALVDENDDFHDDAVNIWNNLREESNIELVTSNYMIDESLTLLRNRCGINKALILRDTIRLGLPIIKVVRVKMVNEMGAWKWFVKDWSNLSFTDCVTFSQMELLKIKRVFGFDKHFERAGFILEKKER